ncbi:MAG TPA: hypothetical protein VFA65_05545 [Bryobacteraceae bacterium]|nr:hypothetical protein [Bryobacteraceae bacterium]
MNLSDFFKRKPARQKETRANRPAVKEAAREALRKYEKTFVDLARYDRGEQSFRPVSR